MLLNYQHNYINLTINLIETHQIHLFQTIPSQTSHHTHRKREHNHMKFKLVVCCKHNPIYPQITNQLTSASLWISAKKACSFRRTTTPLSWRTLSFSQSLTQTIGEPHSNYEQQIISLCNKTVTRVWRGHNVDPFSSNWHTYRLYLETQVFHKQTIDPTQKKRNHFQLKIPQND